MFKFSTKFELPCERPALTLRIDEIKAIPLNNGYTLQFEDDFVSIIKKSLKEGKVMSMLSEKKQEILAKIDALLAERNARIDEQVKLYRESLEAEPEPIEVVKLREVIKAIDVIIDSEEVKEPEPVKVEEAPAVEEVKEEIVLPETPAEEIPAQKPLAEEAAIEELPSQEDLHLEAEPATAETEIKEVEIPIEPIPVAQVVNTIPAGEVVHAEPERPGLAEIQIPERG